MKGQSPGQHDRQQGQDGEKSVNPRRGWAGPAEPTAGQQPGDDAGHKAEEMRAEVGVLVADAEQSEQGQGGGQGPEPSAGEGVTLLYHADTRQQADGAEKCRRSPDRAMVAVIDPGVEQIAGGAAQEHQAPTETGTKLAADEDEEKAADADIPQQVQSVGMEGEGGNGPPPLAVQNLVGIGVAERDPVDGRVAERQDIHQGHIVEDGQDTQDGKRDQVVVGQDGRFGGRRPVAVFLLKKGDFFFRQGQITGRCQQVPPFFRFLPTVGDAAG